jgi:hypothetical protein
VNTGDIQSQQNPWKWLAVESSLRLAAARDC